MKKILLVLAYISLFVSCKKTPLPPEEPADPVFYLKANLDGEPISLEAGNNDYYMHSSFSQGTDMLYVFRGDLKPSCVQGCGYALTVLIDDYKISLPNGPIDIDASLHTGPYLLNNRSFYPTEQSVLFHPDLSFAANETYSWKFMDDKQSIVTSETYSLVNTFQIGKTYTVGLTYDDGMGGCRTLHTNIFRVGNPFQCNINAIPDTDPKTFNFSAKADEPGNYEYFWEFGDGITSTSMAPQHSYSSQMEYRAKLRMVSERHDTCFSYYQISTINNSCHANYTTSFLPLDYTKVFRSITILLTDNDGNVYSSADATQPASSHVEIQQIKDFDKPNKLGEPTKMVTLRFDCLLKNGNRLISLSNATAVVAVSYK